MYDSVDREKRRIATIKRRYGDNAFRRFGKKGGRPRKKRKQE